MTVTTVTFRHFWSSCYALLPNWSKWHSIPKLIFYRLWAPALHSNTTVQTLLLYSQTLRSAPHKPLYSSTCPEKNSSRSPSSALMAATGSPSRTVSGGLLTLKACSTSSRMLLMSRLNPLCPREPPSLLRLIHKEVTPVEIESESSDYSRDQDKEEWDFRLSLWGPEANR